jgi:hypothetical protein
MCDDVDRKPDIDEENQDAEAIADAAGAPEPNLTGDNTKDREAVNGDNILYMPMNPRTDAGGTWDHTPMHDADAGGAGDHTSTHDADAGGAGNHPPTHDADATEQPDEGDGDNDGDSDDDDDLDVLPYDELDEAAALHKEDWRRPTMAWPEPVVGEEAFNDGVDILNGFMILPEGAPEVLSLWAISTYALKACNLPFAPRLMISAPGANSGKTTLLELLTYLVRHPEPTSDITPASFYRSLNAGKCVLLDEADHNLPSRAGSRNELVQMLNAGHKRATAVVIRTESVKTPHGTVRVNRRYPIFAPVAMAGIGTFGPNTTRSRCYEIRLKRKMAHEEVGSFNPDEHAVMMRELRAKIHRFVADNKDAIRECRPVMDNDLLHNRQRDNSRVLLQIADVIGGQVPARARAAIKAITRGDAQDIYEVLLEDIASILLDPTVTVNYAGTTQPANMRPIGWNNTVFSSDLCELIGQYFPQRETYAGFTQARLAGMLSRFDIEPEPRVKRRGSDNGIRWYRRDAFDEWFVRYGFEPPDAVETEIAEPPNTSGEPEDTPAEAATPIPEVPDQEVAGSNVAPSVAAVVDAVASERVEPTPAAAARITIEPKAGEKKRAASLRSALDASVKAGMITRDDVLFESPWFAIIEHDGQRSWATTSFGNGGFDLSRMDGPPVVDRKAETIKVAGINVAANLSTAEFQRLRSLVNKYLKACAS